MKKLFASTLILSTALLVGCNATEQPNPEPPIVEEGAGQEQQDVTAKTIYPMAEGSYWKYQLVGQDQFVEQKVVFVDGSRVQLEEVDSGTTKAIVYEYLDQDNKLAATNLVEEFYAEESILNQPAQMENVILQGPFEVGATWENNGLVHEITGKDEIVSTPAGNFNSCLLVHTTDGNGSFDMYTYYKPGIGIVKEVSGEGEHKVEKVLVEYNFSGNE